MVCWTLRSSKKLLLATGWEVYAVIQCFESKLVLLVASCSNKVVLAIATRPLMSTSANWTGLWTVMRPWASARKLVSFCLDGGMSDTVCTDFFPNSLGLPPTQSSDVATGCYRFEIVFDGGGEHRTVSDVGPIAQPHGKPSGAVTQCNRTVFQIGAALWAIIYLDLPATIEEGCEIWFNWLID